MNTDPDTVPGLYLTSIKILKENYLGFIYLSFYSNYRTELLYKNFVVFVSHIMRKGEKELLRGFS